MSFSLKKIKSNSTKMIIFLNIAFILLSCLIINTVMILVEQKSVGGLLGFITWHRNYFFKSYLLIVLLFCVLFSFGRLWISTALTGGFCFLFALINNYKLQYRGEPLLPWDVYSISEASKVVGTLDISYSFINIFAFFIIIVFIMLSFKIPNLPITGLKNRIINGALIGATSLFCLIYTINNSYINSSEWPDTWFRTEYYNQHGLLNSFLYNFRYLSVEEPEGYSKERVDEIIKKLKLNQSINESHTQSIKPNIIFIMSESFWDASELNSITFEKELLPNLNNIRENFVTGEILSPKFGGGTSNVEFEALTGFTNDTLPDGSIPYQQFINDSFFSITRYLKEMGYDTLAIHSDEELNWNRLEAYKHLGFTDFISSEDFSNPEMKRGRISDMAVTDRIISEYEKHKSLNNSPWFNFTVTVQNHTGYSPDNFTEEEKIKFSSTTYLSKDVEGQLSDYATGIHYSDYSLGKLIDYFEDVKEPTLIIIFGDHRTNLGNQENQVFYETNYINKNMDSMTKNLLTHTTPLAAWSNYSDIKMDLGLMAPYQIIPSIFTSYGLEKPKFFQFLNSIQEISTGSHLGMTLDENGKPNQNMTLEQKEAYKDYKILQYDYILGKGYCKKSLFDE